MARVGLLVKTVGAAAALAALVGACSAGTGSPTEARAGFGGATPSTQPRPVRTGGTLTIDVSADTDTFNPYRGTWSVPSYVVANAVFEPLATVDAQGIARPYLAESIAPTGDFLNWTITTRPNVQFQNGEPFDAAALKKNLDLSRTTGIAAQGNTIVRSIEVISDRAVTVHMSQPWATYPATLAMQQGYMAAPAMLDDPAGVN